MSATAAIAAASAANSAAASASSAQASREAKKAQCMVSMKGFEHDTASVQQKQAYMQCVEFMNPIPSAPPTTMEKVAVGSAMAFVLIPMIAGILMGNDFEDSFMGAILGALSGASIWIILACCVVGAAFIMS